MATGRILENVDIVQVALLQHDVFKADPNVTRFGRVVNIATTWARILIDRDKQLLLVELAAVVSTNQLVG